ncbi:uracil-DNA glycosylase [bacterium]|nr:uracil-DNA glycosylase [bacterium]
MEELFNLGDLKEEWKVLLIDEMQKDYFKNLLAYLQNEHNEKQSIFPATKNILRVFQETDLSDIRVVILGQDPYHGPGQAIGRSFAVPKGLMPKPPSLKNIFKEIEADLACHLDQSESELDGWVKQGVFLLNTVLSVRENQAFSHRNQGWETFTDRVIQILNERDAGIVFLLWGAAAQKKSSMIDQTKHFVLAAPHPSPLSAHRGFLGCKHFSKANEILTSKLSLAPIDWSKLSVPS